MQTAFNIYKKKKKGNAFLVLPRGTEPLAYHEGMLERMGIHILMYILLSQGIVNITSSEGAGQSYTG